MTNGCAWNAVSAFANCGHAVAHVRGSYVPCSDLTHAAMHRRVVAGGRITDRVAKLSGESGLTFAKKVATVAEAFAKPVAFHDCSGPVTLAVSTHLAMACPNVVEQEITRGFYYGWYHECVDQLPRLENGFIRPPEGHGLGLSLAADILTRPDAILRTTEA